MAADRKRSNSIKGKVLQPIAHVNRLSLLGKFRQSLHESVRRAIDLILNVQQRTSLIQRVHLAYAGCVMNVVQGSEGTRLCIWQTPSCISWRLQESINDKHFGPCDRSTDLDQRVPRAINDLGGFKIIDAILIGSDANDGSMFIMQIHIDLVALSRVC